MSAFQTVRGMRDFLPKEAKIMKYLESKARRIAELYGYKEIITPVVESYELLAAKAGEEVRLRMYAFKDLGGRMVALRPEFTPSVARLVATTLKNEPKPFRLFCIGSLYRYDEPQQGRYREFWQSNFELIGSSQPEADAEILMLTNNFMKSVGLKKCTFKIGHVGVLRGILSQEKVGEKTENEVMQLMDKKQYEDAFKLLSDAGASERCMSTLRKLVELRGEVLETIKMMREYVKDYENALKAVGNLDAILSLVSESEKGIKIKVDAGFARGLEYYTGIIFEVEIPEFDKALAGGGRYDKLVELFGGEPTPAVGIAHGIDRIMLAMMEQKIQLDVREGKKVMVIPVNSELKASALKIAQMLRGQGISTEFEIMGRKITRALEDADRRNVDYVVIVGERELKDDSVVIRDLKKREQKIVKIEEISKVVGD